MSQGLEECWLPHPNCFELPLSQGHLENTQLQAKVRFGKHSIEPSLALVGAELKAPVSVCS